MGKRIQDEFSDLKSANLRFRRRHREACNAQSLKTFHKRKHERPEHHLYLIARARARTNKLEFQIQKEDIIIPEFCPIRNVKLSYKGSLKDTPSIDRLDNSKGYLKDNIRVISRRANVWKSDMTNEEIERLWKYTRNEV